MSNFQKYRPAVVEVILENYATGLFTVTEICAFAGISVGCFYHWKKHVKEFRERLADAEKRMHFSLKQMAVKNAIKLINGYEYTETHEEFEMPPKKKYAFLDDDELEELIQPVQDKPVLTKRREVTKHVIPNARLIEFVLTKLDRQNFGEALDKQLPNATVVPVFVQAPTGMQLSFPSETDGGDDITPIE